ncbi:F-box domain-containing protein [Favolaschia claudopus]|uniref:F-box domain-containing protein n=1 Tax=Favolaschia claudopus TaxID=2862362 RepID=A0AAW0AFT2_9AGAR
MTVSTLQVEREHMAALEAQIADLERRLAILRDEKALVQDILDAYKYPVLELPNEIVSEIFIHFVPPYPSRPPNRGTLSPTLLTQICARWRRIALSTTQLWRAVHIAFWDDDVDLHPQIQLADTWFSRAGLCPLSLEISGRSDLSIPREEISDLAVEQARWEYLKINVSDLDTVFGLVGPMPRLRHIDVDVSRSSEIVSLEQVPLLCSAVLSGFAPSYIVLPWNQLTSLALKRVFPNECPHVLQLTTNLTHCEIAMLLGDSNTTLPEIHLPQLQSLAVKAMEEHYEHPFIRSLVTPALRRLEVSEVQLGTTTIETLQSLFSKSQCNLEELHIIDAAPLVTQLQYSLAFPSIATISVSIRPEDTSESSLKRSMYGESTDCIHDSI